MLWARPAVGAPSQIQGNSHCMCTLLALFPHNVGAVEWSCLCMCTSFIPSWCCQINQSLYVQVNLYVLAKRWCCPDKPVSVCARYLLCPLTTLVLSHKPVSVCARYLLCPLTMLALSDEAVSIWTACVLFFTTVWIAGGHWWATRIVKDVSDLGNQHSNGRPRIRF